MDRSHKISVSKNILSNFYCIFVPVLTAVDFKYYWKSKNAKDANLLLNVPPYSSPLRASLSYAIQTRKR